MKRSAVIIFLLLTSCSRRQPAPATVETIQEDEENRNSVFSSLSSPLSPLGLDTLGGAKFCNEIIAAKIPRQPFGFFADTFGDALPCIKELVRRGKASQIRIHLAWDDNHNYNRRDFDRIAAKASRIEVFARENPSIPTYISGACEHNLSGPDAKLLRAKVLAKCPHCAGYVNSVWKGTIIDGINEVHGANPKIPGGKYIVSWDGNSAVDGDVELWKSHFVGALIRFLWVPRFNGRWSTTDNTPREQRKGWADSALIESVSALEEPKGATHIADGDLYKSHAENKGTGDNRAERPAVISKIRGSTAELSAAGHTVIVGKYYGPYTDGRFRYYLPDYGYRIAEAAKRASGSPICTLKVAGQVRGTINPAFRDPAKQ